MHKRVQREISRLLKSSENICIISDTFHLDKIHLEVQIQVHDGPNKGVHLLDVEYPSDYPFTPPRIKFKSNVVHGSVDYTTGYVCLDIPKSIGVPLGL